MSHEHVARVFELGLHEGAPFLVMELVDGESLASELRAARSRSRA